MAETGPSTLKIGVINHQQPALVELFHALQQQGYSPELIQDDGDSLFLMNPVDVLIMDIASTQRPRSSKYIRVPTILVLTTAEASLPPWLQAKHIFLRPYPTTPDEFISQLPGYLLPHPPDFAHISHPTEHLALLFGITQFLSGPLDINDLFQRILNLAPYLEAEYAALLIVEEKETLHYHSIQPGREELTGPVGRRLAQRLLDSGLEGWVLRHNSAVVVPNTNQEPRWLQAPYLPNPPQAAVLLPIALERVKARGVFLIGHSVPEHFTTEHLPLLEAVTGQIKLALENALLFRSQNRRSIQLALINEVNQAAASIFNLEVMLTTVVQAIRRSFTFYSVAIYLYTKNTHSVDLSAEASFTHPSEKPSTGSRASFPLKEGLPGWAAATVKTILVDDLSQDPRYTPLPGQPEFGSELCVPIAMGGKIIAVLDLKSTRLEAFDRYHVSALETLADQLAIAIENARLYEQINQHVQELTSLNEIGQAVTSTLDLQETLTLITGQSIRLLKAAAASVALIDREQDDVWFAAASGEGAQAVLGIRMERGRGIAGWVADQGQPVIVPDVQSDTRFFAGMDKQSGFHTQSIMCVPLTSKGNTIGALEVMNKHHGTFDDDDLSLLQALAIPAATAIENAQLYREKTETIRRLAETQDQLIQSAKLAAVGELVAGIAHEINNPLTTIIGLTGLLLDTSPSLAEEDKSDLEMVNTEALRARDIVRHLLNFARTDVPRRQRVDFNHLVEEAIILVYTKAVSQRITLEKSLAALPEMYLDTNQIKQVLVNLLNNAIQAMGHNNQASARLGVVTRIGKISGQPSLICQISDTGQGIKAEHMGKIFDPFFTTKEVGQGTGLGLSISYGIIEQHGGTISVESSPGQRTTFTITLPAPLTEPDPTERRPHYYTGATLA